MNDAAHDIVASGRSEYCVIMLTMDGGARIIGHTEVAD